MLRALDSKTGSLYYVLGKTTLTVALTTHVYKRAPVNLLLGQPCNGLVPHPRGGGGEQKPG